MALVLASQSPRRRELMALITPSFEADAADIDELAVQAASPAGLAGQLALQKAAAVAARRAQDIIIGCDTVVEVDARVLGKPHSEAEAAEMIRMLRGRVHVVHTGVAIQMPGKAPHSFVDTTQVWFSDIPDADIAAYIKTAEPYDKAGAYGIQGWAAKYIPRIEGCYYNVMGLPVGALHAALKRVKIL